MAKQRKPVSRPLAKVRAGDIFAMPLEDGRWGACRVLQMKGDPLTALVATSPWIGSAPPDLTEPKLLDILRLTHHSWGGAPCLGWVSDLVPPEFVHLGNLPPKGKKASCNTSSDWSASPLQRFLQWRWDHERAAVEAEEEARRESERAAQETRRRAYKPLPKHTLEEMRKRPFPQWEGFVETKVLRASRKVVRNTIDTLRALGPDAPEPLKLNVFHACVEQFNDLDGDGWICTMEREDICELLDHLADLVGLEEYGEALTSRRDW